MLAGERPAPLVTPTRTVVDWRELQRQGIAPSALPPSVAVAFREQSPWERQKGTILIASLVVAIETALIVALVWNGRRRREIQRRLETRVRFERLLSEFSVSLAATPAGRLDEALDAALARVAVPMRIDWVWRWDGSAPEDAGWPATLLNDGEPAWFGEASSLPPSIQRRLREAGAVTCSTLAVPLTIGEVMSGALFGVSPDPGAPWAEQGTNCGSWPRWSGPSCSGSGGSRARRQRSPEGSDSRLASGACRGRRSGRRHHRRERRLVGVRRKHGADG